MIDEKEEGKTDEKQRKIYLNLVHVFWEILLHPVVNIITIF